MIVSADPCTPISAEQWEALRERWPNGARLTTVWRLARDFDALRDLLAGQPVSVERLRASEVRRARRASLVQLVAPLDLLSERQRAVLEGAA